MEKQKRINTFVICGLLLVVGAMTIGFANLSQRLDVSGTATIKGAASSWNVYFSNVTTDGIEGHASYTTTPSITTDTGNTGTNNKITFACDLSAPGDSCTVTATVKNGGTLPAKYTGYTFTIDDADVTETEKSLSDKVKVTLIPEADWTKDTTILQKDSTGTFVVKMEFPASETTLPSTENEHKVELSINFSQAEKE